MHGLIPWRRRLPAYHVRWYSPQQRSNGVEWWMGTFEELPGCMVQGTSMDETEAKLWRVLPEYLEQLRVRGIRVPEPVDAPTPSVEGITLVMVPAGVRSRPSDPGVTAPTDSQPGQLRSASSRADAGLLGS